MKPAASASAAGATAVPEKLALHGKVVENRDTAQRAILSGKTAVRGDLGGCFAYSVLFLIRFEAAVWLNHVRL